MKRSLLGLSLWGCLGLALLCVDACSGGGVPVDCQFCKVGHRRCHPDKIGVLACQEESEGCASLVLEACPTGTQCTFDGTETKCTKIDTNCNTPVCQSDQKQCSGEILTRCVIDATAPCGRWVVEQTCKAGERCDNATGSCVTNNSGCQPKIPQKERRCVGDRIYWFNDCDQQGGLVAQCTGEQNCENGQCVAKGCQPTEPQKEKRCVGNDLYWFDDCGKQGALAEKCTEEQVCKVNVCEAKQQGGCNGTNECQTGDLQCKDGGVQSCELDPQTQCYKWGTAIPCASGFSCKDGKCEEGSSGGTTEMAGPCTKGPECKYGVCILWPSGYCSASCSSGKCPSSDSACVRFRTSSGDRLLCLKKCSTDADCGNRAGYSCKVQSNGQGLCGAS